MGQEIQREKVLVVDDTPENIQILMETLRDRYAIVAATSGKKALELAIREPRPDIVLLDVMMPEMDGYEVCAKLREDIRTRNIPVIFVTAMSEEQSEIKGLNLGAVDYITKPIKPDLVQLRVRNHLELKKHRDRLESMVAQQVAEISDSQLATIFAVSKLAEARDEDTGKHLERTQTYCRLLATELFARGKHGDIIDLAYIDTIYNASPLHDIGKVSVPDGVLCKPGKLTDIEFEIMKSHTARGAETLQSVADRYPNNRFINMGLEIARSHHEKWDGTGYPDRVAGTAIPLSARIMAIADVYDALTSKRCYKEAFTHERSRDIIEEGKGSHFDPAVVDAFLGIEEMIQTAHQHYADDDQVHESRRWERAPQ